MAQNKETKFIPFRHIINLWWEIFIFDIFHFYYRRASWRNPSAVQCHINNWKACWPPSRFGATAQLKCWSLCVQNRFHYSAGNYSPISAGRCSNRSLLLAYGLQEEAKNNGSPAPPPRISEPSFYHSGTPGRTHTWLFTLMIFGLKKENKTTIRISSETSTENLIQQLWY